MAREVTRDLGDGDAAVHKTLREMMCRLARRDAADPRIQALAKSLRRGTERATTEAIFRHVVNNIRYANDPENVEYVAAPIYTLGLAKPALHRGDCDDMVTALAALLGAAGIRCRMRVIAWKPGINAYTHVNAVAVLADGARIPLDPVMGHAGWNNHKTAGVRREYEYECVMKGITLEDKVRPDSYPIRGLSGCACGGKCNGRCGRKRNSGCCPMNSGAMSPVNVNVITSAGGQDFSSSRAVYANDGRTVTVPATTGYIRESSQYVQQTGAAGPAGVAQPRPAPIAPPTARLLPPSPPPSVAELPQVPQSPPAVVGPKKLYREFY